MLYTSTYIYTPNVFLENHVLGTNKEGIITEIRPINSTDEAIFYEGILCPGFVNAHCHLELSALKGCVPKKTGMTGFAGQVVNKRKSITDEENLKAIEAAIQEMWESGTQAVGDICNEAITASVKKAFPSIFFYNFIEVFGMREDKANDIWEKAENLLTFFKGENQTTNITLHAPYSISLSLLEKAKAYFSTKNNKTVSIHLLESKAERAIFEEKSGEFADFYKQIGIDFTSFPTKSPIEYVLSPFDKEQPLLLVHNTEITEREIEEILTRFPNTFFCLCPRSNLYIHGTFPDIDLFLKYKDKVCLGTDSLASNHSLEMLAEIYEIQQRFDAIDLHILLTWLIPNGAAALQQGGKMGHFEIGKNTGIIHISNIKDLHLTSESRAIRIV